MDEAFRRFERVEQAINDRLAGPIALGGDRVYRSLTELSESIKRITDGMSKVSHSVEQLQNMLENRRKKAQFQIMERMGFDIPMLRHAKAVMSEVELRKKKLHGDLSDIMSMPAGTRAAPLADLKKRFRELNKERLVASEAMREATPTPIRALMNILGGPLKAGLAALAYQAKRTADTLGESFSVYERWSGVLPNMFRSVTNVFKEFTFLSSTQLARIQTTFARQGLIGKPSEAAARPVRELVNIGVSPEAATKLTYQVYRISGWSKGAAMSWQDTARSFAKLNNVPTKELFEQMAANADLMANAANRTPNALAQAVTQARRLGVEVGKFEAMADRFTGDFDVFLEGQAKLQTVLPGVDLTNVMMASQYGSTKDVQDALQGMLGGRDIGQLPRSIRNMIAQTLGMSVADLVNIAKGKEPGFEADIPGKQLTVLEKIQDSLAKIGSWLILGSGAIAGWQAFGGLRAFLPRTGISTMLPSGGGMGRAIATTLASTALFKGAFPKLAARAALSEAAGATAAATSAAPTVAAAAPAAASAGRLGTMGRVGGGLAGGLLEGGLSYMQGASAGQSILRGFITGIPTLIGGALGNIPGAMIGGMVGHTLANIISPIKPKADQVSQMSDETTTPQDNESVAMLASKLDETNATLGVIAQKVDRPITVDNTITIDGVTLTRALNTIKARHGTNPMTIVVPA